MKQRWLGRRFRPVTAAMQAVFGTLTSSFRPWNYHGVMEMSRTYRHAWVDVTSYDGLIEGIDEQPWWRSRMLKAAAVSSFELMHTSRRANIHDTVGICIAVALELGFCVALFIASPIRPDILIVSILLALIAVLAISVVAVHTLQSWRTASLPYLLAAFGTYVLAAGYTKNADTVLLPTPWKIANIDSAPAATLYICAALLLIGGATAAITDLMGLAVYIQFLRRTAGLYFPCILMRMASQLESDPDCHRQGLSAQRAWLVNGLYFVNSRIDLVTRGGYQVIDPLVRQALQSRLFDASLCMQSLALQIALKTHQEQGQIIRDLRCTAVCLLFRLYDHLPTPSPDDAGHLAAGQRNRKLSYWLRWAILTLLPAVAVIAAQLVGVNLPEIAVQWLAAFAIAWGLVRVIAEMEPNYRATIEAARELLGDARNLGGRQE